MLGRTALLMLSGAVLSIAATTLPADDAVVAQTDAANTSESSVKAREPDSEDDSTTTSGVQFEVSFSGVTGATLTTTNGQNEQREGNLTGMYAAYASVPEEQPLPLVLRVTEDPSINGPDGQPGVLRLQHVQVPLEANYSGFLMYGHEETGKMQFPGWTLGDVSMNDLRRTFIEFKFRAENPSDADRFGTLMQFRIEPDVPDSYRHRADFGALIATGRWRTFRRPIGSASNLEQFLDAVNGGKSPSFKLVWGQNAGIQNYAPGDSLLIDDLRIVVE